jgi:transposase
LGKIERLLFPKFKTIFLVNILLSIPIPTWIGLHLFSGEINLLLGEHGYSRDHRLDKKQINIGISELAEPINIPIGVTVQSSSHPDMNYFTETFNQIMRILLDKWNGIP